MADYLVTGVAGFIGSRVTEMLLDQGDAVIGFDDLNAATDVRIKEWRLSRLQGRPGFEFRRGDLCDRDAVDAVVRQRRLAAVIHLAARAGVRPSVLDPWTYVNTNVTGTLNLLDACVRHDIGKVVFASSSSVYGAEAPAPCPETAPADRPLSPYAATKVAGEALCRSYHALRHLDISMLRYFTVYGPAGRPDMAPFRFVQWICEGRPVTVYGDGKQTRDFTYVDDVARGTIAALRPVGCEAINLGSHGPVPLMDALHWIEEFAGRSANIVWEPPHPADVPATFASIEKAERVLGWRPTTEAHEGLRRLVEWYLENRDWAATIDTR